MVDTTSAARTADSYSIGQSVRVTSTISGGGWNGTVVGIMRGVCGFYILEIRGAESGITHPIASGGEWVVD